MPADWRDFFALTKPRVMRSVVFTGLCGMLAAPVALPPALALTAVLCIAVAAGAAGALNQWYEADIDALMRRTADRPLPAGRMDPQAALQFGVGLGVASVLIMGMATNVLAAALLAGSILFYVLVYTVGLKRRTPQNIVIGGAAGAFPPMIGWVAATGSLDVLPVLMFLLIFLWTPPHSWALALRIRDDYAAGTVPMMPVVTSAKSTRRQMLFYAVLMSVVAVAPWALGMTGALYGVTALVGSAIFLAINLRVVIDAAETTAEMRSERALFLYSIGYILVLFGTLAIDRSLHL
ncbi:MAG: heme o synthase [Sphingomonadales bacterium]